MNVSKLNLGDKIGVIAPSGPIIGGAIEKKKADSSTEQPHLKC